MENFKEKACLCTLNRIFGFEPKKGIALVEHFGCAAEVFRLNSSELDLLLGPYSRYKAELCQRRLDESFRELENLQESGISFCGYTENTYPPLLKECPDAPLGLYLKTRTPPKELWRQVNIAIVGTRDVSPYGKDCCRQIVHDLSLTDCRPTIVSGLALGTDIEAHRTAIETGLPTIGVMATGPDLTYPHRHRDFAERMAETPGCALVTDYPPGTPPLAIHFIRRNRIIAGLSNATVLIESKKRGGGMITCRLAHSYDRDVYALPGRIDDIRSQGCNELIRRQIAEPVTSAESLIRSLGMKTSITGSRPDCLAKLPDFYSNRLSEDDISKIDHVLSVIRKEHGITISELPEVTGLDYRSIIEITGILETEGIISCDLLQRCRIKKAF